MKLVPNSGTDRVIDLVRPHLKPDSQMGCVTPSFSLFAFAELRDALAKLERVELILPTGDDALEFLGGGGDRANRNQLQARWLANQCADWAGCSAGTRTTTSPQSRYSAPARPHHPHSHG